MKNRLFVCGDTHGMPRDTQKLTGKNFPEQKELSSDDVVVQLGDFGWVWHGFGQNREQEYWLDWLASRNYTLAVVPGNHENYDIIDTLPLQRKWGGEVKVLQRGAGAIYFLERGAAYEISGRKILAVGGAESSDRERRTSHVSWWEQERLSPGETEACLAAIDAHGGRFDYVLSHTCPARYVRAFTDDALKAECSVARFLDKVDDLVTCDAWHFGHFHWDRAIEGGRYRCHYIDAPFELK